MDQRDLVGRAQRGDHDAFARLVHPALARLDAAARLVLRDPELARDAVQEALIRAWRDLPGSPRPGPVRRLAPPPDRQRLSRPRPSPSTAADGGRAQPARLARHDDPAATLADRELVDAALARASIPATARWSPCTTSWGCRCRWWRHPWASRSARPSPGCTTPSRRCGRSSPSPSRRPGGRPRRAGRMTADIRPDGRLTEILEELYLGRVPDYRDEVLAGAVAHRQRPAWTFPGRWLPMADIARRPAFAASLPWRAIGLALVLIALLLAAAVAIAGSRQHSVPAPFGLARNGVIAWYATATSTRRTPSPASTTAIVTGTAGRRRSRVLARRDATRVRAHRRGCRPSADGHRGGERRRDPAARHHHGADRRRGRPVRMGAGFPLAHRRTHPTRRGSGATTRRRRRPGPSSRPRPRSTSGRSSRRMGSGSSSNATRAPCRGSSPSTSSRE